MSKTQKRTTKNIFKPILIGLLAITVISVGFVAGKQYLENNSTNSKAASTLNLVSFGSARGGFLGNGTDSNSFDFVQASNVSGIIDIDNGSFHTIALKSDGTVVVWGSNQYSQLGQTISGTTSSAVTVPGINNVVSVKAGQYQSLALKADGTVWQWGGGSGNYNATPTQVPGLPAISKIFTDGYRSQAITPTGAAYVWGSGGEGSLGIGTSSDQINPVLFPMTGISQFSAHSGSVYGPAAYYLMKTDGTVWQWGRADTGIITCPPADQGFYSSGGIYCKIPKQVQDTSDVSGFVQNITNIGCSYTNCVATKINGDVVSFGYGLMPILVPTLSGIGVSQVSYRVGFVTAVTNSGALYTLGDNSDGQQGLGINSAGSTSVYTLSSQTDGTKAIGNGRFTTLLKNDGTVWGSGDNGSQQLGSNTTSFNSVTPTIINSINLPPSSISDIQTGEDFTAVLKNDGTVWTWGKNAFGQLGNGTNTRSLVPVQVSGLTGITKISVNKNSYTVVALKNDGTVWVWGYGAQGNLGNGANNSSNTPVQVPGITTAVQVANSVNTTGAVLADGTVKLWGNNSFGGKFGDATLTDSNTPVTSLTTNVKGLYIAESNTTFIKNDNTVWQTGYYAYPTATQVSLQVNPIPNTPLTNVGCSREGCHFKDTLGQTFYLAEANNLNFQFLGINNTNLVSATTSQSSEKNHYLVTEADGKIYNYGANKTGNYGSGSLSEGGRVQTVNLENVSKISNNGYVSYAVGYLVDPLTSNQINGISFSCPTAIAESTVTCTFTLPPNVSLPASFKLGIGNSVPGGSCSQSGTDYSQNITVTCTGVPAGTSTGNQVIYAQIGSGSVVNTGEITSVNPRAFSAAGDLPFIGNISNTQCNLNPATVIQTITCSGSLPSYISTPLSVMKFSISDGAQTNCTFSGQNYLCSGIPAGTVPGTFPFKAAIGSASPVDTDVTNDIIPVTITSANIVTTGASCNGQNIIITATYNCTIPLTGATAYVKPNAGISAFTSQGNTNGNLSTNVGVDNCTVNGTNLDCTLISTIADSGSTFTIGSANVRLRVIGFSSQDQTVATITLTQDLNSGSIPSLTISCTSATVNSTVTCTFTLPPNVNLPPGFAIQIGNGTPGGTCTNVNQTVTCTGISTGTQTGVLAINAQIGSSSLVNSGETVSITGSTGADSDADGVIDSTEITNGTNPFNADTDGDGLTDGQEIITGTNPLSSNSDSSLTPSTNESTNTINDGAEDLDGDGLTNIQEFANGTNPNNPDSDGDGMPDGWEVANGLNPNSNADATGDLDNDGLTNKQEYDLGFNPSVANSDSNTTSNTNETTDARNDGDEDLDGDGISNKDEFLAGTNPRNSDTDGDGVSDSDEIAVGTDPLLSTSKPIDLNDIDGDGIPDTTEKSGVNGGDANGDGIPDYKQKNVTTVKDPNSTKFVVVEADSACRISNTGISQESTTTSDPDFDYINGFANYTLNCSNSNLKLYWYNIDTTKTYTIRKFGPITPGTTTNTYYDFTANITKPTIGGATVVLSTFNLSDGQKGDSTVVDGKIVDPAGLATPTVKILGVPVPPITNPTVSAVLPRTGGASILGIFGILTIATTAYYVSKKRNKINVPTKIKK